MQNLYRYCDYRDFFHDFIRKRKTGYQSITFKEVASAIRVEKSYVSKVMNKKAHFSVDQLYATADYLKLQVDNCYFLELLHILLTSNNKIRVQKAKAELLEMRKQHRDVDQLLSTTEELDPNWESFYFSDPLYTLINEGLSIQEYQEYPRRLASGLSLSYQGFCNYLNHLISWGVVKKEHNRYVSNQKHVHVKRESASFRGWLSQLRNLSLANNVEHHQPDSFTFSATFATDTKTRTKIMAAIVDLVEESKNNVEASKKESLMQLNIDFHSWL